MKKLFCMLLCTAMLLSMASLAQAEKKTVTEADVEARVAAANAEIHRLVDYAIATPENDVKWLQQQVKKIVKDTKSYAKKGGFDIGCEMENFFIDGEWVLIDPLYVINIRQ